MRPGGRKTRRSWRSRSAHRRRRWRRRRRRSGPRARSCREGGSCRDTAGGIVVLAIIPAAKTKACSGRQARRWRRTWPGGRRTAEASVITRALRRTRRRTLRRCRRPRDSLRVAGPHRHQLEIPVHASDARSRCCPSADRPGHVRAVAVVVIRRVVLLHEIPAERVVGHTVVVVVAVPGRVVVRPPIRERCPGGRRRHRSRRQRRSRSGRRSRNPRRPSRRCRHRRLAQAQRLVEAPIVRRRGEVVDPVRLGVEHLPVPLESVGRCGRDSPGDRRTSTVPGNGSG